MLVVAGLIVFVAAWAVLGSLVWVLLLLGAAVIVGIWLAGVYNAVQRPGSRELVPRSRTGIDVLPGQAAQGRASLPTAFEMRQTALRQWHVLAQQGNAFLAGVFVQMNEVYEKAVGRVIEQKKQIHNGQHRQLAEAFFESSARELGQGLLENYRQAEGQVKRVTSVPFPLEPEPHPVREVQAPSSPVIEYRRLTLGERLRGEVLVEHDG